MGVRPRSRRYRALGGSACRCATRACTGWRWRRWSSTADRRDRRRGSADRLRAGLPDLARRAPTRRSPRPGESAIHGIIEFTNRQLTFLVAPWCCHPRRRVAPAPEFRLALLASWHPGAGGARRHRGADRSQSLARRPALPAVDRDHRGDLPPLVAGPRRRGGAGPRRALLAAASPRWHRGVLALGTVVTGSGPHAGDPDRTAGSMLSLSSAACPAARRRGDAAHRGSVGMLALTYALHSPGRCAAPRRPSSGWSSLRLPSGSRSTSCTFPRCWSHSTCSARAWCGWPRSPCCCCSIRGSGVSEHLAERVDHHPGERANHRAVDADELQVATDL